ncbi:MAG: hypothetical protein WCF84_04945 [Anaerolineae bacterium]
MPEPLEVERELEELRARVRGMESRVKPPPELTPLQKAISGVNTNWHLSGKLPVPVHAPLAWRVVYFVKRVARRIMVELLNTIVEQQNGFNAEVARALTELAKENNALRQRVEELEKRRDRETGRQGDK